MTKIYMITRHSIIAFPAYIRLVWPLPHLLYQPLPFPIEFSYTRLLCDYYINIGDTGETIIVRGCALDSGTLTTDTEIIRMSHCGGLYFDER